MVDAEEYCREFGGYAAMLRSEICFWREMIDSCGGCEPPGTVERMRYALALAETRLATLLKASPATGPIATAGPGNVFQLERWRN